MRILYKPAGGPAELNLPLERLVEALHCFMPLAFITGFFDMNFFQPVLSRLTPWTGSGAFLLTLLIMVALPLTMFQWMRRRAWM